MKGIFKIKLIVTYNCQYNVIHSVLFGAKN